MRLDPRGAVWTVRVGFTSTRPVIPDEHTTYVQVEARDETEARTLAAQIVGTQSYRRREIGRPEVQMVTSCVIESCEV